ncbi:hypothetical protein [Sinorhizobium sp. BG8]|uniref:hypothetical protein n=1 Tax=Sinorhizobium sp. BG8 TaxID=2613773 RepID=UPI00193E503C|nr:hypothetical protein [Sinorhizobium sp. BG8]QRM57372.1 hypothetical protein F3Y30_23020 [Sinorhizobium sp. BG8]
MANVAFETSNCHETNRELVMSSGRQAHFQRLRRRSLFQGVMSGTICVASFLFVAALIFGLAG